MHKATTGTEPIYMSQHKFLHNLLFVLAQTANKIRLQKKKTIYDIALITEIEHSVCREV
jgi:hypothetical protein